MSPRGGRSSPSKTRNRRCEPPIPARRHDRLVHTHGRSSPKRPSRRDRSARVARHRGLYSTVAASRGWRPRRGLRHCVGVKPKNILHQLVARGWAERASGESRGRVEAIQIRAPDGDSVQPHRVGHRHMIRLDASSVAPENRLHPARTFCHRFGVRQSVVGVLRRISHLTLSGGRSNSGCPLGVYGWRKSCVIQY